MKVTPILLAFALIAGCASQPHPAASAAAPAAPPARDSSGDKPTINKELVSAGYVARVRKDRVLYCRNDFVTGTQFKRTTCYTEQEIQAQNK